MKAHVKRSEKSKQRRLRIAEERRTKRQRSRERTALINSTVKALSAKPKMVLDLETQRVSGKIASFGARYGASQFPKISEETKQKLSKAWNRMVYGTDEPPENLKPYTLITADYSELELRTAATVGPSAFKGLLDHKTSRS